MGRSLKNPPSLGLIWQSSSDVCLSYHYRRSWSAFPWIGYLSSKALSGKSRVNSELNVGSLTLEFDRLSYWSGNDSYRARADSTSRKIMGTDALTTLIPISIALMTTKKNLPGNPQIFPGLHAQNIHIYSGLPLGDHVGWGGNSDSFLEVSPQSRENYVLCWNFCSFQVQLYIQ